MKRKMVDWKITAKKKTKPEWPSIKPKSHLQINRLEDDDLFDTNSKAFINVAESIGFVHQDSLGPTMGEAYRDNHRISVDDPVLAETIWEGGLSRLFSDFKVRGKFAVWLNPNSRFYRYSAGQRFGRHIVENVDLGEGK